MPQNANPGWVLDVFYPEGLDVEQDIESHAFPVGNHARYLDSPGMQLLGAFHGPDSNAHDPGTVTRSYNFKTYLLYKFLGGGDVPEGILVPIAFVSWGWGGTASHPGVIGSLDWQVVSTSRTPAQGEPLQVAASGNGDYPVWEYVTDQFTSWVLQ